MNHLDLVPHYRQLVKGALQRAEVMGYSVDVFWAYGSTCRGRRLNRILESRSVMGAVLCAMDSVDLKTLQLQWDQFSFVQMGSKPETNRFHYTAIDYYHATQTVCQRLLAAGHQAIGLSLHPSPNNTHDFGITAAYREFQSNLLKRFQVPIHGNLQGEPQRYTKSRF
ncbi:MAG: hypothetical protein AAF558_01830 [Verrucomicrobiota bacterium]